MNSVQQLYQRFLKMKNARQNLENTWRECYEFALPQRESSFSDTFSLSDFLSLLCLRYRIINSLALQEVTLTLYTL